MEANGGVAVNQMSDTFAATDPNARLWPHTEHLRTARMGWETDGAERYAAHTAEAALIVEGYLKTPVNGLWRDTRRPDGTFIDAPAPGRSLYHLIARLDSA